VRGGRGTEWEGGEFGAEKRENGARMSVFSARRRRVCERRWELRARRRGMYERRRRLGAEKRAALAQGHKKTARTCGARCERWDMEPTPRGRGTLSKGIV